jgi:hypothetical protein
MPLAEGVHCEGQEIEEELEETGRSQWQHCPPQELLPHESEQMTGLFGPQSRVTLMQRSSIIALLHSVFSSVHCSQAELEDVLPEVEEADEILMEVLEEETGLHPQHAPSQDVTPQVPLHVET